MLPAAAFGHQLSAVSLALPCSVAGRALFPGSTPWRPVGATHRMLCPPRGLSVHAQPAMSSLTFLRENQISRNTGRAQPQATPMMTVKIVMAEAKLPLSCGVLGI